MHDIMEGVENYTMTEIISYYLKKKFTLPELNNRVKNFDFGAENVPPEIKIDKTTNQVNLKMSVPQMKSFVHFFGCIIGHRIKKPHSDDYDFWNIYTTLKTILMIACSPKITSGTALQLKDYIKEFCALNRKLVWRLKPKFHLLLHYPAILLKNGLLIKFWRMRNESRHTGLKAEANAVGGSKKFDQIYSNKRSIKNVL